MRIIHFILFALLSACLSALGFAQTAAPADNAAARLTLRECLERATTNHPLLKAAQLRREGSEELSRYAGVRPNPTFTLQTENWRAWQRPPYNFGRDMDIFLYGTQRIETAGKAARRREFAAQQVETAQAEIEAVRRQLRQEVTRNFWFVLQAQTLQQIAADNRRDLDQLVEHTSLRVREGFAAESELIRARLEQQNYAGQEAALTQALERAKLDLFKAMGATDFDTRFELVPPPQLSLNAPVSVLTAPLEQLRNNALAQRPELLRLRAEVVAARAYLKLQEANARPDVEVTAGYKRTGGYNTAMAYVTVPLPLFNKNRGEIGRAAASLTAAEQTLQAAENYIRAEVETAYRGVITLAERVKTLQRSLLQQADESRGIALVAYREGAADLYKLLETQRARNDARLLYYRTLQEFQAAQAELTLTIGEDIP